MNCSKVNIDKSFILAGNAIVTISNGKGTHFTFRIRLSEATAKFSATYFVSLLTGSDNTSDYSYLGILNADNGTVRLTGKSCAGEDAVSVKVIKWAFRKLWNNETMPEGYSVCHEGYCGRCSRLLTVPSSVASGYGPECIKLVA